MLTLLLVLFAVPLACAYLIRRARPPPNALEVCNVTLRADLGHRVDLAALVRDNPACVELREFPGASVATGFRAIRHIIFSSGKVVVTGAKSRARAERSFRAWRPRYEACREA